MKYDELIDELTHARANYWIVTVLCGVFIGLLSLSIMKGYSVSYVFCYGVLAVITSHFSLRLDSQIKSLIEKLKRVRFYG